jgi:glyoxylase-like metal-dependent hydrolase (beta-lactamase superfamily II)
MIRIPSSLAAGLFLLGLCFSASGHAQAPSPLLGDETVQVSEHVWAIMGFPNIGIVVGPSGTLVVDTGLGNRNGATVARVAARLGGHRKLYLTTTHFHPEHAAGVAGFPPGTVLVRNAQQQREMAAHGQEMIELFAGRSAQMKELLTDARLREPDVLFDNEYGLDLGGGVKVRLLWFGAAHTKGDELVFVEPDRTLISGDVVQNKVVPNIYGEGGTASTWLAVLDRVQSLGAQHVLPDHSAVGDGSLVTSEKAFISDLQARALALKMQGVAVDEAGTTLTTEFKARYPGWQISSVAGFVKTVYAQ